MTSKGGGQAAPILKLLSAITVAAVVAACGPDRIEDLPDGPFAPGVDPKGEAVEGTDALLERCRKLVPAGPRAVLVKCSKPGQDRPDAIFETGE